MAQSLNKIDVYLEIGKKRTFAGAIEWPGWYRSGRDVTSALQAVFDDGSRYERVLRTARLGFRAPDDISAFSVIEHLEGNETTDFGAPGIAPSSDADPVNPVELQRFQNILKACWQTIDADVRAATGKALRTGPRGGGRLLEGVIQHVLDGDAAYLAPVGWKLSKGDAGDLDGPATRLDQTRQAILKALTSSARGEIPARGPRYFVRYVAWHTLDHAWEIEDRVLSG